MFIRQIQSMKQKVIRQIEHTLRPADHVLLISFKFFPRLRLRWNNEKYNCKLCLLYLFVGKRNVFNSIYLFSYVKTVKKIFGKVRRHQPALDFIRNKIGNVSTCNQKKQTLVAFNQRSLNYYRYFL